VKQLENLIFQKQNEHKRRIFFAPQILYHHHQVLKANTRMVKSLKYVIPSITHLCSIYKWSKNPKLLK
jgi:hypothetical protein